MKTADQNSLNLIPLWSGRRGEDGDVVLSTRIRLARNLDVAPFPYHADTGDLERVAVMCLQPFRESDDFRDFVLFDINALDEVARAVLVERHLVSASLILEPAARYAVLSPTGTIAVMINEEDHVRLQCFLPGRNLREAWEIVDGLDDWLSRSLRWSFSPRFGYLTTHLANLGTGLRASAMVHLPALTWIGRCKDILRAATNLGVAVRGLYGEGSDSAGHIYQVSNRFALGPSEDDILTRVDSTVRFLVKAEREARGELLSTDRDGVADKAARSYGILRHALRMSTREALDLLSYLKLGIDAGLNDFVESRVPLQLFLSVRPAALDSGAGQTLDVPERERVRATWIRECLQTAGGR
ncbi:MAG TPA: ATP--guanido phosphotransferase [Armatimonadota bacterium]|nr:ATP--guanido phosphotransferase [Armatimonadota bacterium]